MSDEKGSLETDLIDLDGISLADLEGFDDSVLVHALRRVLADSDDLQEPIASFQAFI